MSEQSERLARQIRKSLGEHNDDNEPVIILVERLRREVEEQKEYAKLRGEDVYQLRNHLAAAQQRIEKLEGALRKADMTLEHIERVCQFDNGDRTIKAICGTARKRRAKHAHLIGGKDGDT